MLDLGSRLFDLILQHRVPGAAVALVQDGEVATVLCTGLAHPTSARPVTAETIFQAASLSKCLTGWAVLRLVERGAINLDDPVERHVHRWRLPPSNFEHRGVTIRRILSHMAGLSLPDYPGFEPRHPLPSLEESLAGNTNGGGGLLVIKPPGAGFQYSGGGYTLLQLMIEEVGGIAFAEHMRQHILAPLGMLASDFEWRAAYEGRIAQPFDGEGNPLPVYRYDGAAAAGLYATVVDLSRFVAAWMASHGDEAAGRGIVSPTTLRVMSTPVAETGCVDGLWGKYGLACEIEHLPSGGSLVGHHGMNRGWRTLMAISPELRIGMVALVNSDRGMPVVEEMLDAWLELQGLKR